MARGDCESLGEGGALAMEGEEPGEGEPPAVGVGDGDAKALPVAEGEALGECEGSGERESAGLVLDVAEGAPLRDTRAAVAVGAHTLAVVVALPLPVPLSEKDAVLF